MHSDYKEICKIDFRSDLSSTKNSQYFVLKCTDIYDILAYLILIDNRY